MLISVEKLRQYIDTELSDSVLEAKLRGLELMIRAYTHNNFQVRSIRSTCSTDGEKITGLHEFIKEGDTIEVSDSFFNDGVYTVKSVSDGIGTINSSIYPEEYLKITKVVYPENVVLGAIDLLKWEMNNREKVGVSSETISRHSVTYFNMDGSNSSMGFPSSLLGFLEPYRKARF